MHGKSFFWINFIQLLQRNVYIQVRRCVFCVFISIKPDLYSFERNEVRSKIVARF